MGISLQNWRYYVVFVETKVDCPTVIKYMIPTSRMGGGGTPLWSRVDSKMDSDRCDQLRV